MIFVSFGNSPKPFYRLAEAIDSIANKYHEKVVVQNGYTEYNFKHCISMPFVDQITYKQYLTSCKIVILQGGWGGVSEASDLGCRIVAVPRMKGLEHYHDQEQLIRQLEKDGVCLGCYDMNSLYDVIERARTFEFKPIKRGDASRLINDFISSL